MLRSGCISRHPLVSSVLPLLFPVCLPGPSLCVLFVYVCPVALILPTSTPHTCGSSFHSSSSIPAAGLAPQIVTLSVFLTWYKARPSYKAELHYNYWSLAAICVFCLHGINQYWSACPILSFGWIPVDVLCSALCQSSHTVISHLPITYLFLRIVEKPIDLCSCFSGFAKGSWLKTKTWQFISGIPFHSTGQLVSCQYEAVVWNDESSKMFSKMTAKTSH